MKTIIRDEVHQSNSVAIADDRGNKITYRKLEEEAEKFSRHIEERSLIFILCDYHIETIEFLYTVLNLNRVPLLLATDINQEMLDNLIDIYRPQYIYCDKGHQIDERYDHEVELNRHVLLKTCESRFAIHPEVALLLSTSGTTGSAKMVKISYNNLYNNSEYACRHLNIERGQKGLSPLPVNYTYGFAFCLWHWHCGATLLITEESVLSNKFKDFYIKEEVNNFAATPYVYKMLQKIRFWDENSIAYLNFALSGGGRMANDDQINLVSLMKEKFWSGYGQTECTCVISAINFDDNNIKIGTVGKAFENMEIIIDDNTKELLIKSESVCMGYATNKEQLAVGDENHGFLHTGDIAYIDKDGYIYLQGRLKRFVKILEKRVSLDDIESYMNNNYAGVEFACTGEDDNIFIFHTEMQADLEKEIVVTLDRKMKIPKKFITFVFLEKIPIYDTGKIIYSRLEEIKYGRENKADM